MLFLKDPHGPHSVADVGAVQCVVSIDKPIVVGNANIPGQEETGIRLEEVAFTIFYPASVPLKQKKGLRWLAGCVIQPIQRYFHKLMIP